MRERLWEGACVAIPTSLNGCTGSLGLQVKGWSECHAEGKHHLALTPLPEVSASLLWLPLEDLGKARRFCNANLSGKDKTHWLFSHSIMCITTEVYGDKGRHGVS